MNKIKDSVEDLVGKTIESVVLTRNFDSHPQAQLILCFDDKTSFEFWVDHELIQMASKVDDEDVHQVVGHIRKRPGTAMFVFDENGRKDEP